MTPRYDGIVGRIINAIYKGDVDFINSLYKIGLLQPHDTFDTTGNDNHGGYDAVPILHVVAQRPCPDYKALIFMLIENGADVNSRGFSMTPLEEAILSKNYPTAMYLEAKGSSYDGEKISEGLLRSYLSYKVARIQEPLTYGS
jgi:hypothetical protein